MPFTTPAGPASQSLSVSAGSLGHVTVGDAFLVDADGRMTSIDRSWVDGALQITVPAAVLATDALPVTVDPVWETFSSHGGLAYQEKEETALKLDIWNVFMTTGELVETGSSPKLALTERHVPLATSIASESSVALAMNWDDELNSTSVVGAAIWSRENGNGLGAYGQLEGAAFEYILSQPLEFRAVGVQYGSANSNPVGPRNRSWLRILGDQATATPHLAQALDLPPNS